MVRGWVRRSAVCACAALGCVWVARVRWCDQLIIHTTPHPIPSRPPGHLMHTGGLFTVALQSMFRALVGIHTITRYLWNSYNSVR